MTKSRRFRNKIGSKSPVEYSTSATTSSLQKDFAFEKPYTLYTQNLIIMNSTSFDKYYHLENVETGYTMSFTTVTYVDQYILESKDNVTIITVSMEDVSSYVTSLAGLTSQAAQTSLADISKEILLYNITEKQKLDFTQPAVMSLYVVTETNQVFDTSKGSKFFTGTISGLTETIHTRNSERNHDILALEETVFNTQHSLFPESYNSTSISVQTMTTGSNPTLTHPSPNSFKKFWYANGLIKLSAVVCTFVLYSLN